MNNAVSWAPVIAALIMGAVAFVLALVTWVQQINIRTLTSNHEVALAEMKAKFDREGATHESSLRVQAEVRLRLFERSAESTQEVIRALYSVERALAQMDGEASMRTTAAELILGLSKVGLFLPPELDQPFADAIREMNATFHECKKAGSDPAAVLIAAGRAVSALMEFQNSASKWKRRAWEDQVEGHHAA
jgi:hypothetical protein